VANSRGLCHYDNSTDSFIKDRLDIPSKEIFSITENNSQLWLTTVNCLVRYELNGESVIFTPDDGLVEGQFIANSAFRASNGKIYVGTNMGFNSFFPSQIKQNTISPRVVFTGLDIANEKILPGDKRMPRMLNDLDEIVLSHEDYAVTIHFASLSYCNPDKNQYAFMMEGFDKDWTYSGNNGTATYTNLPAGKYRFLVRATNNDGKWCDNPIVLTIKVTPPWWLSLPMKILYMIQVLIFLAIIIRLFLKRSEKKHQVEIKSMEDRKEKEVYQAKLDFFTMIAHEIRTPVSLIMGPLEKIMHSSYKFTPEVKDDLEIINRNNDRLLFLVNQLLDFEKVEQNALSVYFKPQHMAQLINAVVERFKPSVEHMGGHLTINNFNDSFIADVDAEAFTKLISNLLNNARKFMKDTIHVECKVHPEAGTFSVAVSDNGIGVSKDSQEKIFKPFFQVQNDSQVSRGGTGIGLSIVRNVVEGHGGTIDVDSEEGKGATFTVTIPIHNARAEESFNDEDMPEGIEDEAIEDTIECSDRQLILVVEDNPEMQSFIAGIFRSEFEVITASDGVEALELLHKNTVTLIISDWMMPRMDGVQLCKAVRGDVNYSHIPFILLTAKTDNHSKIEGVNCGADVYIEKPFSVQYLSACVHNIIDMRDLLRKKFSSTPLVPISAIATNQTENDFLVRLNEVIEENFSNPDLSVDFLAEQMNISRSSLYAKIKTLASISPNELILIARLKKAAVLLKDGNYRIKEICAMVGFNSPSYFTKCFYRQFGVRPTDFTGEQPQ
jgi:signal transduction histidine kinase/DNA-binding response OmpR family regulator